MHELFPQIEANTIPSVSQLTARVKEVLEPNFKHVWVKGELSNLRRQSSGHYYFSLKDTDSQIPCVFFNRHAQTCDFELSDGAELLLFGDLSVYEPYGRYQFMVKQALEAGTGDRHRLFEQLKQKLHAQGLFDKQHKKPIPGLPKRIALVTSPTGAAIQDFLRILKRRNYSGNIDLFPVLVQGASAKDSIEKALQYIDQNKAVYDCLVLTRGGGSIEDLWTFNEESLAHSLYNCRVPSISAIGHEIDTVLSDLVADYRAETPSGAAEYLSSLYLSNKERLIEARKDLHRLVQQRLKHESEHLVHRQKTLSYNTPQNTIDKRMIQLDLQEKKLSQNLIQQIQVKSAVFHHFSAQFQRHHPRLRLVSEGSKLSQRARQLGQQIKYSTENEQRKIQHLQQRLNNSSMQSSLKRGFVILKNDSGSILSRADQAEKESEFEACFIDGSIALEKNRGKMKKFGRK